MENKTIVVQHLLNFITIYEIQYQIQYLEEDQWTVSISLNCERLKEILEDNSIRNIKFTVLGKLK